MSNNNNNKNLHKAKEVKNDEFYTLYKDVHEELKRYDKELNDKVVYCNCDVPFKSNFYMYFLNNLKRLGLKRLICTSKAINGEKHGYKLDISRNQMDELGGSKRVISKLNGNGDFRSE